MSGLFRLTVAVALLPRLLLGVGPFDNAVLHGETDKARAVDYAPGETMVFTLSLQDAEVFPAGEYFVRWERTGDDGKRESGRVDAVSLPLVVKTSIDSPGFVYLYAEVVDRNGAPYAKSFRGDRSTPDGHKAANRFERLPKNVFFSGSAGADVGRLQALPEPSDFDAFWARQSERLARVPLKAERREVPCGNPKVRLYAVEIPCAGLRPATGYLSVPKGVDEGRTYPAKLTTHGYSYHPPYPPPENADDSAIVFELNAFGVKLQAFGGDEGYYKAFGWEIRSNGMGYAFDPKQNEDPETAFFNGMVLRIKRTLQYLKTVEGWNGKDLIALGNSQGGLQSVWAAACGEGVTYAESGTTWCCDMGGETLGRFRGPWYIHWAKGLGYYDPVNHARRIPKSCRLYLYWCGLGDTCSPPSGLAILWNNLTCPSRIRWIQGSTHGYVPTEPHQEFCIDRGGFTPHELGRK